MLLLQDLRPLCYIWLEIAVRLRICSAPAADTKGQFGLARQGGGYAAGKNLFGVQEKKF